MDNNNDLAQIATPIFSAAIKSNHDQRYFAKLLAQFKAKAIAANFNIDVVDNACYALCAWIDEFMANKVSDSNRWLEAPLQLDLFKERNAGEHFFARLAKLRTDLQKNYHVIMVFYLCMQMGFKGYFQIKPETERQSFIANLKKCLNTANSYQVSANDDFYNASKIIRIWPWLVLFISMFFVLFSMYLVISNFYSHIN